MMEKLPAGIWAEQFKTAFDYPPTPTLKRYALCTSPRSGSHFVGHLLHAAGGFGYPLEYVHAANFKIWTQRARAAGAKGTFEYIKSVRTDTNGVFGVKLHYRHLQRFLENEPEALQYKFITLERRDVLKQAVSYCWATQTKSWISGMPPVRPATYDWQMIADKLTVISESNAGWRRFFASLGLKVCDVVFEEATRDPVETVNRIAAFLDVTPLHDRVTKFFPKEQADPEKEEWAARFIAEARERLARGDLLPAKGKRRSVSVFRSVLQRLTNSPRT